MAWEIEYTDEFGAWWNTISTAEQDAIAALVPLLEEMGLGLGRPSVDTITASRYQNMTGR
ncbi:MAG: hypothetical protein ACI9C1_003767 [Candidatus Aldehydirespiratoraceae bacterium]